MNNTIRALMVVAHPDDCVIFGWPFIKRYSNFDWKILYLTYNEKHPRGNEIKNFWSDEGVSVDFCGVHDDHIDLDEGTIVSFNKDTVAEYLLTKLEGYDIFLTHGRDGEYGHPHHVFLNSVLKEYTTPKVFFSNGYEANLIIKHKDYKKQTQNLDILPLHREIIEAFTDRYDGFYLCDEASRKILNGN